LFFVVIPVVAKAVLETSRIYQMNVIKIAANMLRAGADGTIPSIIEGSIEKPGPPVCHHIAIRPRHWVRSPDLMVSI